MEYVLFGALAVAMTAGFIALRKKIENLQQECNGIYHEINNLDLIDDSLLEKIRDPCIRQTRKHQCRCLWLVHGCF